MFLMSMLNCCLTCVDNKQRARVGELGLSPAVLSDYGVWKRHMPGGLCEAIPAPTRDSGFSPSACVITAGAWIMVALKCVWSVLRSSSPRSHNREPYCSVEISFSARNKAPHGSSG